MNRVRNAALLSCLLALPAAPAVAAGRLRAGDTHLKIQSQKIRVRVEEGYSVTEVEQVFRNTSDRPTEAVYDYPLPPGAAFSGLSVWVDGKEIQGEVLARSRAEAIYTDVTGVEVRPPEQIRGRFKEVRTPRPVDPALIEQAGRRLRLRVAPVPARGIKRVKIRYVQPVKNVEGVGRYVYPLALEGAHVAKAEHFSCEVLVASPRRALLDVSSPSHGSGTLEVLAPGLLTRYVLNAERMPLEKDLEIRWRTPPLNSSELQVSAERGPESRAGTVQLTLTPVIPAAANTGVDVAIVIDTSASMLQRVRELERATKAALDALKPGDRFDVVAFDLSARSCFGKLRGLSPQTRKAALRFVSDQRFAYEADPRSVLREVGKLRRGSKRPLDAVLISDPSLSDSPSLLRTLSVRAREARVRVFAVELGSSREPQAPLARLAARTGALALTSGRHKATRSVSRLMAARAIPVIRDPQLRLEGVELAQLAPARPPTVLVSGEPVHMYARYTTPGVGRAILEGTLPDGSRKRWSFPLALPAKGDHLDVRRLWARAAADDVEDRLAKGGHSTERRAALEEELTAIALAGPVLTRSTGLIVLESEALFERYQITRTNRDRINRERSAAKRRREGLEEQIIQAKAGSDASAEHYAYAPPSDYEPWPRRPSFNLGGGMGGGAGDPFSLLLVFAALGAAAARKA